MHRMDELHLEYPFAGSRMLRDLLTAEGIGSAAARQHTDAADAIETLYRLPNMSKPAPGHKITRICCARGDEGPNQVWAMDISVPQQAA